MIYFLSSFQTFSKKKETLKKLNELGRKVIIFDCTKLKTFSEVKKKPTKETILNFEYEILENLNKLLEYDNFITNLVPEIIFIFIKHFMDNLKLTKEETDKIGLTYNTLRAKYKKKITKHIFIDSPISKNISNFHKEINKNTNKFILKIKPKIVTTLDPEITNLSSLANQINDLIISNNF